MLHVILIVVLGVIVLAVALGLFVLASMKPGDLP
jgi:hypothetical protein